MNKIRSSLVHGVCEGKSAKCDQVVSKVISGRVYFVPMSAHDNFGMREVVTTFSQIRRFQYIKIHILFRSTAFSLVLLS